MEIARLVIVLKDGTELDLGQVEVKQKVKLSTQHELTGIIREKIRITEPILT